MPSVPGDNDSSADESKTAATCSERRLLQQSIANYITLLQRWSSILAIHTPSSLSLLAPSSQLPSDARLISAERPRDSILQGERYGWVCPTYYCEADYYRRLLTHVVCTHNLFLTTDKHIHLSSAFPLCAVPSLIYFQIDDA